MYYSKYIKYKKKYIDYKNKLLVGGGQNATIHIYNEMLVHPSKPIPPILSKQLETKNMDEMLVHPSKPLPSKQLKTKDMDEMLVHPSKPLPSKQLETKDMDEIIKYLVKLMNYNNDVKVYNEQKELTIGEVIKLFVVPESEIIIGKYIVIKVNDIIVKKYRILRFLEKGKTNKAFLISSVEPTIPSVLTDPIKLKEIVDNDLFVLKISTDTVDREGEKLDKISKFLEKRVLALFQGTSVLSFGIYNYLGNNLSICLSEDSVNIRKNAKHLLLQLHTQISKLNMNNIFHNDLKNDNITVNKLKNYELTVIDFGNGSIGTSYNGSLNTMCTHGIIQYLLQHDKSSAYVETLKTIFISFRSSDYVGFFYVFIDIICAKSILFSIYSELIFNNFVDKDDRIINLLKLLFFFYYITINKELWRYDELIKHDYIRKVFEETRLHMDRILGIYDIVDIDNAFPFEIGVTKYDNLRRFLFHIHEQIIYSAIQTIKEDKLPKLLFDLGRTCLQPDFNLHLFTYKDIFLDDIWAVV
jgi:hypothetical protein